MSLFRNIGLLCALSSLANCSKGYLDTVELDQTSLGSGLMAYYTFDEGAGTVLIDHSVNQRKRHGYLSGGEWINDGAFGGALHLTGAIKDHGDVAPFPDATENFSVSVWTRASAAPPADAEALLSMERPFEGGWQLHINRHVDNLSLHVGYWDTVTMAYVYSDCDCLSYDRWTHVAFVRSAAARTLTVYVDGSAQATVAAPNPIAPGELQLHIGHWELDDRYLTGDLDDVAIYERALASDEVLELSRRTPL
jgi:hypothetical protein